MWSFHTSLFVVEKIEHAPQVWWIQYNKPSIAYLVILAENTIVATFVASGMSFPTNKHFAVLLLFILPRETPLFWRRQRRYFALLFVRLLCRFTVCDGRGVMGRAANFHQFGMLLRLAIPPAVIAIACIMHTCLMYTYTMLSCMHDACQSIVITQFSGTIEIFWYFMIHKHIDKEIHNNVHV